MGCEDKQLINILEKPVLAYTLEAFEIASLIDKIFVVTREINILIVSDIIKAYNITKAIAVIPGGDTRAGSVKSGLDSAAGYDFYAIHDGARPCILPGSIDRTVSAALTHGAAALGCPAVDTLKTVGDGSYITGTVDRSGIWHIQTPQVFKRDIIIKAYENIDEKGLNATDDCALVEKIGVKVFAVNGPSSNIKITHKEDINIAAGILACREAVI